MAQQKVTLVYAVGIESRYESGFYTPDQVTQDGESTAAQQDETEGDYSVQSIYGEVSIPVTDALTIEAATRYDNYSTFRWCNNMEARCNLSLQ